MKFLVNIVIFLFYQKSNMKVGVIEADGDKNIAYKLDLCVRNSYFHQAGNWCKIAMLISPRGDIRLIQVRVRGPSLDQKQFLFKFLTNYQTVCI